MYGYFFFQTTAEKTQRRNSVKAQKRHRDTKYFFFTQYSLFYMLIIFNVHLYLMTEGSV